MKKTISLLGLLLLLTITVTHVFAASNGRIIKKGVELNEDIDIIGDNLTVEEGAIVNGDVAVAGGNAIIDGIINGDFVIAGGNVTLNGEVNGDIAIFGGNLEVGSAATLSGECILFGGNINGDDNSFSCFNPGEDLNMNFGLGIDGIEDAFSQGPEIPELPSIPDVPTPPVTVEIPRSSSFIGRLGELIGRTMVLGLLAWVVAAIWPQRLQRVEETVMGRPFASGAVGLLTTGAYASLMAILSVIFSLLILACGLGLLGFPVLLIMSAAIAAAAVMGWVAIGHIVGSKISPRLKLSNKDVVNVTVTGTVVLTFALGIFGLFGSEGLSGLLMIVLSLIGLGAAALTKLGREPYPSLVVDAGKIENIIDMLPPEE